MFPLKVKKSFEIITTIIIYLIEKFKISSSSSSFLRVRFLFFVYTNIIFFKRDKKIEMVIKENGR